MLRYRLPPALRFPVEVSRSQFPGVKVTDRCRKDGLQLHGKHTGHPVREGLVERIEAVIATSPMHSGHWWSRRHWGSRKVPVHAGLGEADGDSNGARS